MTLRLFILRLKGIIIVPFSLVGSGMFLLIFGKLSNIYVKHCIKPIYMYTIFLNALPFIPCFSIKLNVIIGFVESMIIRKIATQLGMTASNII
jgi:hypothetical protein